MKPRMDKTGKTESDDAHEERLLSGLSRLHQARARMSVQHQHRETLQLREKVLGKEHPDTLTTMNQFAGLLKSQGKYDAAEPLYRETLS